MDREQGSHANGVSQYLTAEQIATELGVSVHTIRRAFRRHQDGHADGLPGRRVGKSWQTTRTAVDSWLTGEGATVR